MHNLNISFGHGQDERQSFAVAMQRMMRGTTECTDAEPTSVLWAGGTPLDARATVAMAQAGFSTLLVDADLRRPSQHRIWNVQNDQGLSTILTRPDHLARPDVTSAVMPNLTLITSGPLSPKGRKRASTRNTKPSAVGVWSI